MIARLAEPNSTPNDTLDALLNDVLTTDAAGEGVSDADPIAWIQHCFYIPETNGPMPLYPSQIEPLREALRQDQDGNFVYSTVCWSAIKKSAKSSIAAAVGLWMAFRRDYASIKVIANDLKQAESRVYYYMRRCLELNDKLGGPLAGCSKVANYKILLNNGSFIEAIPIDPKGEAGGNDDLVIYSEIWGWKTRAALQMWTESTLSPMKYGQSIRWCETYAGSKGDSPVLEQLYQSGVTDGQVLQAEYEMYANADARQFTLWTTRPSLPWQTDEYYEQERATLSEGEFDRVHRNQWTTFTGRVLPDFDHILNVTEAADYSLAKGSIFWGCDDGFAPGKGRGTISYHPRAVILAQRNHLGGIDIFEEYEQAGVANHQTTIDELLSLKYPKAEAAVVDSSADAFIHILRDEYDIYAVGGTHPVSEGIKIVRMWVCNAQGVRMLRIHPRCKRTIEDLEGLRFAETGTVKAGEMAILPINDHLPACVRYLVWILSGS